MEKCHTKIYEISQFYEKGVEIVRKLDYLKLKLDAIRIWQFVMKNISECLKAKVNEIIVF